MQIKQTCKEYISIAAVALMLLAPKITHAQFVGNPLIPMEGKVIIYTNDAKGGHHQVANIAARDNISSLRRQPGMLCTVMDDGTGKPKTYQLISADEPAALENNANWVAFDPSGGVSTPVGAAGGDLTGEYPNPTIAEKAVTPAKIQPGTADQVMVTTAEGLVAWVDKSTLSGGSGSVGAFNGDRPITGDYYKGVNPGTNDLAKWIETVFYPSLGPSASLTSSPSGTLEMGSGGSTSVTLNWSVGRAAQTEPITEIVVNGQNVFSSSPAAGASVSGTISTTTPGTGTKTFTMSVKTADNKTASASASISFQYKRYWGFVSGGADGVSFTPSNAQILALSGSAFATSAAASNLSATPSGPQKLVIAYPASFGGSKITVGVNDSTGAFDKLTQSFTNASGGTTSYIIWVQKDNTAAGLTFSVQ